MASPITIAPFGAYVALTTGDVVNAAAKAHIVTMFNALYALLPNSATKAPAGHPQFDHISPSMEQRIRAELAAINTAIAASPVA